MHNLKIAVLIPCYNEEATIGQVVRDFKKHLPEAMIYVYDNNSNDKTALFAKEAGAIVALETLQGKGSVVKRMFADINADIYVLVDGDNTYDAKSAPILIEALINNQLDMVSAARIDQGNAYRKGHQFGNRLLSKIVGLMFGRQLKDMLSGYRVFSRRFVKSFPVLSKGFEIETELNVHALEIRLPFSEVDTAYQARPMGSLSKLSTFKDGFKILWMIIALIKREKPVQFFGIIAALLMLISLGLAWPVLLTYLATGLVPRLPTAVLSASLMLLAFFSLGCGLILDTVTTGRKEAKLIAYLQQAALLRK
ncbi:MAG: glycosyl transferase [Gammaproteobacteria bacterium]|jgi:glycosyltransferase involved in cell wall biosynthesis|nr:glycosyl transferase [Gammaproteobacteria bacterium]